jgi:hypothetical protein
MKVEDKRWASGSTVEDELSIYRNEAIGAIKPST